MIAAVAGLMVTTLFLGYLWGAFMNRAGLEGAVHAVLGAGGVVEYDRWHLYWSRNSRRWVVLNFNGRGVLTSEHEAEFDDVEAAVEYFFDKSGFGR